MESAKDQSQAGWRVDKRISDKQKKKRKKKGKIKKYMIWKEQNIR